MLSFDKPKKLHSTDGHNKTYTSDAYVDGTYVPNMSEKDMMKWKAKQIGGDDPRIEIRKTVSGVDPTLAKKYANRGYTWAGTCSAQILVIVRKTGVVMSGNGRMVFDNKTWFELGQVVEEAQKLLKQGGNHGR